jgi:hypothetical protein
LRFTRAFASEPARAMSFAQSSARKRAGASRNRTASFAMALVPCRLENRSLLSPFDSVFWRLGSSNHNLRKLLSFWPSQAHRRRRIG